MPVNPDAAGDLARRVMPVIQMAFVGRSDTGGDTLTFERRLYLTRKAAENRVRRIFDPGASLFHIASLSSRTLVYKGMLLADQMTAFYPRPLQPGHGQRPGPGPPAIRARHLLPSWDLAQPFPLPVSQRRNQHREGQHQLDARQGASLPRRHFRRRHHGPNPDLHPRRQRFSHSGQRLGATLAHGRPGPSA